MSVQFLDFLEIKCFLHYANSNKLQPPNIYKKARYIFTKLRPFARKLFPEHDDELLSFEEDDGQVKSKHCFLGMPIGIHTQQKYI